MQRFEGQASLLPGAGSRPGRAALRALPSLLLLASLALGPLGALAADETYVVQEGDTLTSIAGRLGVSVESLVRANGVQDPDRVVVGLVLKVPPGPPRAHTVAAGETLTAIAARYGVTVEALVAVNQLLDPDRLGVGDLLRLPGDARRAAGDEVTLGTSRQAAAGSAPAAGQAVDASSLGSLTAADASSQGQRRGRSVRVPYLVKAGDTLTAIARQFETTVQALAEANGVANVDQLAVGQTILVPARTLEHQVAPGETLAAIAARYMVDLGTVVDYNELEDPNLIRVGEILAIPRLGPSGGEVAPGALVAASVQPQSPAPAAEPTPPPRPTPAPPPPAGPAPVVQAASAPAGSAPRSGASQPASSSQAASAPAAGRPAPPPVGSLSGMAQAAVRLLGKPYAWGGSSEAGFDCSGFVWYVARQAGVTLSRGLQGQYNAGPHPERGALKPGDIVFFQNTYMPGLSHNGIYVGEGKFVHAADEQSGVTVSRLDDAYWASRWFGATRVGG